MDIGTTQLLSSFLKECRSRGLHIFLVHIVPPSESPTGRVQMGTASTEDDAKSAGMWEWMTRFHDYAVEEGARALFVATGHATAEDVEEKWTALDLTARQGFCMLAKAAYDAARAIARGGVKDPSSPEKPRIIT